MRYSSMCGLSALFPPAVTGTALAVVAEGWALNSAAVGRTGSPEKGSAEAETEARGGGGGGWYCLLAECGCCFGRCCCCCCCACIPCGCGDGGLEAAKIRSHSSLCTSIRSLIFCSAKGRMLFCKSCSDCSVCLNSSVAPPIISCHFSSSS